MSTEHQITEVWKTRCERSSAGLITFPSSAPAVPPAPEPASLQLVARQPSAIHGPEGRGYLKVLAGLSRGKNPDTAQAALTALINLTDSVTTSTEVAALDGYVQWLLQQILDTSSPLADLACMLMSNLTKLEVVCRACLEADASKNGVKSLERLVAVFAREGSNKKASYDYLANVFANVSAVNIRDGRESLLGMPDSLNPDNTTPLVPLADLVIFTEHKSAIRRAGIASTLKNCTFVQEAHSLLLSSGHVNFLPYILLPLCGPEEFDIEDMEKMPEEVQLLPADKKREPDAQIRLMLVETLILLSATMDGREILRKRGVYEVIKVAHKAEHDEDVLVAIQRLVNLLMRGETVEKITELQQEQKEQEDEDMLVQEV